MESPEKHTEKGTSDRSFGLVMSAALSVFSLMPLRKGLQVRWWVLGVAAAFLFVALARPRALKALNRLWMRLGLLLEKITSPVIMGVFFYLLITPVAVLFKLIGKDPLNRRLDPNAKSYWVKRDPRGPAPETLSNQF